MTRAAAMDWSGLENAISEEIVAFVRTVRTEHPADSVYGVAVHELYAEQGGRILSPLVSAASEEWLARAAPTPADAALLRWDAASWPWHLDPTATGEAWTEAVEDHARADDGEHWDAVHDRYLDTVVDACMRARSNLAAEDGSGTELLVLPLDEDFALVRRSLTAHEIAAHLPFLVEP